MSPTATPTQTGAYNGFPTGGRGRIRITTAESIVEFDWLEPQLYEGVGSEIECIQLQLLHSKQARVMDFTQGGRGSIRITTAESIV